MKKVLVGGVAFLLFLTGVSTGDGAEGESQAAAATGPVTASTCVSGSGTPANLTEEQKDNARQILEVAATRSVSQRAWAVLLVTALQESSLKNLAGGDRDSVGLFQQRPSMGWGTPAQLQDVTYATNAFLGGSDTPPDNAGLTDIEGWEQMSLTEAAQAVQVSAHPDAYAQHTATALALIQEIRGAELDCSQVEETAINVAGPNEDGSWPAEACTVKPDPTTGRGCLTPRTAALVLALKSRGITRVSCFAARENNPTSLHPKGRACDISFGSGQRRATGADKKAGDDLAAWLAAQSKTYGVESMVWYGQSWSSARPNWKQYCSDVYGCPPTDPVGGHYEHVHVAVQ